ncbi:MAG: helix-turn-helix domain-containing protein [Oscillospiraceae bacterium]|nr:helix-turn-helix domain-containing protein [Oscillospiraceae bacterium]
MAEKIKLLREKSGLTQAELARKLGLTRSGVNGWEMGLVIPSTSSIVELSKIFNVSTDYLLGMDANSTININGLTNKEVAVIADLIKCFKDARNSEETQ